MEVLQHSTVYCLLSVLKDDFVAGSRSRTCKADTLSFPHSFILPQFFLFPALKSFEVPFTALSCRGKCKLALLLCINGAVEISDVIRMVSFYAIAFLWKLITSVFKCYWIMEMQSGDCKILVSFPQACKK